MFTNKTVIEVATDYIFTEVARTCEEGLGGFDINIENFPLYVLKSTINGSLIQFMGKEEVKHYETDMEIVEERIQYLADNMYKNINVRFTDSDMIVSICRKRS